MLFDKNKVYGYDERWMIKNGEPDDNDQTQTGNETQLFTQDEIWNMFPAQLLILTNIERDFEYDINFNRASVAYFHCSAEDYYDLEDYPKYEKYSTYKGYGIGGATCILQ